MDNLFRTEMARLIAFPPARAGEERQERLVVVRKLGKRDHSFITKQSRLASQELLLKLKDPETTEYQLLLSRVDWMQREDIIKELLPFVRSRAYDEAVENIRIENTLDEPEEIDLLDHVERAITMADLTREVEKQRSEAADTAIELWKQDVEKFETDTLRAELKDYLRTIEIANLWGEVLNALTLSFCMFYGEGDEREWTVAKRIFDPEDPPFDLESNLYDQLIKLYYDLDRAITSPLS